MPSGGGGGSSYVRTRTRERMYGKNKPTAEDKSIRRQLQKRGQL
jgi:hypothetical protein